MTSTPNRTAGQGNISTLRREECLALLGTTGVGRIAFIIPTGPGTVPSHQPVIHPVNYLMDDGTIVVRTSPYTMLGNTLTGEVAFEVDDLDPWLTRGWSVLVTGRLAPVDDPDESIALQRGGQLRPWAEGQRNLFLRTTPRQVTGRRIT